MSIASIQKPGKKSHCESDEFYSAMLQIHRGLDLDESTTLNARLVLLLANEIGDIERVKTIMLLAKSLEQSNL